MAKKHDLGFCLPLYYIAMAKKKEEKKKKHDLGLCLLLYYIGMAKKHDLGFYLLLYRDHPCLGLAAIFAGMLKQCSDHSEE